MGQVALYSSCVLFFLDMLCQSLFNTRLSLHYNSSSGSLFNAREVQLSSPSLQAQLALQNRLEAAEWSRTRAVASTQGPDGRMTRPGCPELPLRAM